MLSTSECNSRSLLYTPGRMRSARGTSWSMRILASCLIWPKSSEAKATGEATSLLATHVANHAGNDPTTHASLNADAKPVERQHAASIPTSASAAPARSPSHSCRGGRRSRSGALAPCATTPGRPRRPAPRPRCWLPTFESPPTSEACPATRRPHSSQPLLPMRQKRPRKATMEVPGAAPGGGAQVLEGHRTWAALLRLCRPKTRGRKTAATDTTPAASASLATARSTSAATATAFDDTATAVVAAIHSGAAPVAAAPLARTPRTRPAAGAPRAAALAGAWRSA
mmetsp:Transcript_36152/g.116944  ORF Transcript_36152/g.116944 Transcript_36152/m.116944 type:complete len:284 (-) Transcript_36152:283-1134(-)